MKPFAAQSFYELLEISVSASAAEVRSAWERLNAMYADDQLAHYGLADAATAGALRKRLREALEVLADDELRALYDEELGLPPREPKIERPAASQLEMGELLRRADHPSPPLRVALPVTAVPVGPVRPAVPLAAAPEVPASPIASAPGGTAIPAAAALPAAALEADRISEEAALPMVPRPSPAVRPSAPRPIEIPANAEYNGELLRRVRTELGLSLAVVAERTRIGSKHLENVEADRYDALPATVYLRGILISLAKELRLDGVKVSRSYLSLVDRIRSKG